MRHTTLTRLLGSGVVVTVLAVAGSSGASAGSGGTGSTETTGTTESSNTTVTPTTATPTTEAPASTEAPSTTAAPQSPEELATLLQTGKQSCDEAIDRRLATTATLRKRATEVNLSDDDRNAIMAILDRTDAGLNDLRPQIDNAPDGLTLRPACRSIAQTFRVYRVVVPQIRLAFASAGESAAADKLLSVADKLASASQTHANKRKASVDVDGLLQDIRAKANDAKNQIDGVPATALAVTVAEANAGSGKPAALLQAKKDVASVDQLLESASKDARTVLRAVQG